MAALAPYLPPKDAAFDAWLSNFSTLLTATPAAYGLQAGDAAAVAAAQATWHAQYLLVKSPTTKTAAVVAAKNIARVNAQAIARPYAQQVANNAGVSVANKTALGLNPRTSTPVPITTPTTYPTLAVAQALPLQHVMRFRDQLATPSTKAKPYGVVQLQLFGQTSAAPIVDPSALPFLGVTTKSPFLQAWPGSAKGMTAYYAARWVTRKGLVGPWSPIVSFTVAG